MNETDLEKELEIEILSSDPTDKDRVLNVKTDPLTGEITVDTQNEDMPESGFDAEEPKQRTERKPPRRDARIKELAQENAQIKAELEKERSSKAEITSTFAKRMVETLTGQLKALRLEKISAAQDQDPERTVQLEDAIDAVQAELAKFNEFADTPAPKKEPAQTSGIPAAATDWSEGKEFLINNDEYLKIPKEQRGKIAKLRAAIKTHAKDLIEEGFDTHDPAFYEEIDLRLEDAFPFYQKLASEGLSALEYSDDASGETEKPRIKSATDKAKQIPVKGPSVGSSVSTKDSAPQRGTKVTLTKEDLGFYNRVLKHNGVSLQEFAAEKLKRQGSE